MMTSRMQRWFTGSFEVYKKETHENWSAEPYVLSSTIKGFLQPVSGAMTTARGKVSEGATHKLYCPADSDVAINDRIIDADGTQYIAMFVQSNGVASIGDHQEIDMVAE